jgi:mono/diheme cytochrome c family protein
MSAAAKTRWGRIPSAAFAALAVVMSGCDSKPAYPPTLEYPARSDRLVLRTPTAQPAGLGEPGKLDAELAALDSLGGLTVDPSTLPEATRREVETALSELFGPPAAPAVDATEATSLGLTTERLAEGSRLFRRHCLQCHGLTGDGRGPTGQWIYPHPRDFRRGAFKFVTTGDGGKPRTSDLARTVKDGLKGTGMPSFGLLPDSDRDRLVSYVKFLALRGQTEFLALRSAVADEESHPGAYAKERFPQVLAEWWKAESLPVRPVPATPDDAAKQSAEHLAAVKRGFELFTAKSATDCMTCHEDFGRKTTYRYDVWGTVVRPAELTAGGFKSGDRPEILFHRIRDGIQPAGMPAHASLTDAQVWDLVWFVRAIPFPRELPEDVRSKVYP